MQTGDFIDFVNGVTARVDMIIDETQDLSPSFMQSGLFQMVDNPGSLIYRTQGVTGLNYLEKKDETGNLKQDQTYPAYQTKYVMQEYGKIVPISQMLMKTRSNELEQKLNEVRQLAIASQRTLNKHAWQVLVDGFVATDSDQNRPIARLDDAVSMYSTAHPSKVPGVANRTNRLAANGVMSETNCFTLINLIKEQLNGRGLEIGYEGDFVFVVPPALTKLATEIFKSEKKSDSANNDINYYQGIVDFMSINYLGNASNGVTNADTSYYCFAKNPPENEKSMKYVSLISPKIESDIDFHSKQVKVSIDGAYAFGYSNFEYTAASDGSGS